MSCATRRLRHWNWRLIGILVVFVGLFLAGFLFGEGDWFGLQGREGFWPELALRVVRGLASAILAPIALGFFYALSHLFHWVPIRTAASTWPAVPRQRRERYDPAWPEPIPDHPVQRRGGRVRRWVRRWVVGIALFVAPIYLVWGALRLMGVDSERALANSVAMTLVLWLAVALIRVLRRRA